MRHTPKEKAIIWARPGAFLLAILGFAMDVLAANILGWPMIVLGGVLILSGLILGVILAIKGEYDEW